ncbi:type III pantothenate kinase [Persicitalea jodogahamensis]|uniref:Type III pantothenate kinase n=1 Tax=Persicitalea jodogahamensis TaxID=402147 RepID=A0A8J3DAY2_9BACT|nr:type III pantothenate kinase [Persicitalea jodogahamensis]GHB77548.1 type III pantothenate kinase [Persicitalea jodogahamensis]
MNLVVDAGNTFSKVGWFEGNELRRHESQLTFPELLDTLRSVAVKHVIFSSVSHEVEKIREALQPNVPVLTLNSLTPLPIVRDYDTPDTLGADRIAAAVGAVEIFPEEDCLVIDMGTCITYDLVDRAGRFQGGAISPGMRMRFKAMHSFTQRLPLVEPERAAPLVGKSTRKALLSGVMNGLAAELNGLILAHRAATPECRVVLCGGDASYFTNIFQVPVSVVPELVLIGLNRILIYNVNLQKQ